MASEDAIRDYINNMHMDMKVIEVTYFKSDVTFDLFGYLKAAVALEEP